MRKYKKQNIVYSILLFFNRIFTKIVSDRRKFLALLLLAIFSLFIIIRFKRIFFVSALTAIGAISLIPSKYLRYSHYIGFELCTMATVLVSLVYGPVFGAFTGFVSLFGGFVLSGYFKPTYFISVLVMPIIGLLVPLFNHLPLLYIGMIMTLIYDAIILPLYVLTGSRVLSSVVFFITHILLNLWIFSSVAPFLYAMMT
jgi:hypothetical protein